MLRKGQAAMEFLMTYGWAILVVLIAIGALAYFGVLNPSRFLPESCTIGPGLSCDEFKVTQVTGGDGATLIIRNGMGSQLTLVVVKLQNEATGAELCTLPAVSPSDATLDDGEQTIFSIAGGAGVAGCTELGAPGNKVKARISFGYTKEGLAHTKIGTLTTRVEA